MTSQAERIRAFKLAQHARLQKQDDEEQWISSEELCTEGSSDEDTHTNSSVQRKLKRSSKAKTRGISPLAQPLKKDENISSELIESNLLLPEIPISNSIVETESYSKENKSFDKNMTNLTKDLSETNSEESLDSSEIETMIQWRPKRGSIKLPELPEGIPAVEVTSVDSFQKTDEHALFEINKLFMELNLSVRNLKLNRTKYKPVLFPDIDENEEIKIYLPVKCRSDYNISILLHDVNELDDLISEKSYMLEKVTEERKIVQDEMCNVILNDTDSPASLNKSLQTFLELCHFETTSNQEEKEQNALETNENAESRKKPVKLMNSRKNFINRNIRLAKEYSMAQWSLTDEEKIQLESLLSDKSDSEDITMEQKIANKSLKVKKPKHTENVKKSATKIKNTKPNQNYFKLDTNEATIMENLDVQLREILQSYEQEDVDIHENFNSPNEDILEVADKEGKYWKHEQIRKRLENIQKNLNQMAVKDEEDQKKLKEIHGNVHNDSDN